MTRTRLVRWKRLSNQCVPTVIIYYRFTVNSFCHYLSHVEIRAQATRSRGPVETKEIVDYAREILLAYTVYTAYRIYRKSYTAPGRNRIDNVASSDFTDSCSITLRLVFPRNRFIEIGFKKSFRLTRENRANTTSERQH